LIFPDPEKGKNANFYFLATGYIKDFKADQILIKTQEEIKPFMGLHDGVMQKQTIIIESGAADLARKGAEILCRAAKKSIGMRGHFAVAISGGSTPRNMHRLLGKEPFLTDIQWEKTDIFWVDERCVPVNDKDSNYGSAKKDFLNRVPIPPGHIHPMPVSSPPEDGALLYQQELMNYFKPKGDEFALFDLIYLGIGKDGHTASLFPGQSSLNERERWVVAVKGGKPNAVRLTMTFPVLNSGRQIVFIASGKEKAEIVKNTLKDNKSELPAQLIRSSKGTLLWLLDRGAASFL
jgi:6-phosphogluconolactonase